MASTSRENASRAARAAARTTAEVFAAEESVDQPEASSAYTNFVPASVKGDEGNNGGIPLFERLKKRDEDVGEEAELEAEQVRREEENYLDGMNREVVRAAKERINQERMETQMYREGRAALCGRGVGVAAEVRARERTVGRKGGLGFDLQGIVKKRKRMDAEAKSVDASAVVKDGTTVARETDKDGDEGSLRKIIVADGQNLLSGYSSSEEDEDDAEEKGNLVACTDKEEDGGPKGSG